MGVDLLPVLYMVALALVILSIAEWNYRRQGRHVCRCRHLRSEHSTLLACRHKELIAGFWFHCPCSDYRKADTDGR